MSAKLICSVVLLSVIGFNCEETVRHYNGYSVLRLVPKTETQLNYLRELENNVSELDFWRGPSYVDRPVDVMVPPNLNQTFDKIFGKRSFNKVVLIDDVEKQILEERAVRPNRKPQIPGKKSLNSTYGYADLVANHFDDYQRIEQIYGFLATIQYKYPTLTAIETIGTSYNGRDLRLLKIGENLSSKSKPIIFIEAGSHAREWISSATVQCFAQNLVQEYEAKDPTILKLLKEFDFYILPVLNPDGYEYAHTYDRMWKKTRKPYGSCYGADPNRNWGHKWGGQGASTNPCSENYRGSSPFSESETRAASDYIRSIQNRVMAYIAVHSYGQHWLYPWGYTSNGTPDNYYLNRVAVISSNALKAVYGTAYTVGTTANVLYPAAGSSDDWAYGSANIGFSYSVHLRDQGAYGYNLPASQIRPTCAETTQGLVAFAKQLGNEGANFLLS